MSNGRNKTAICFVASVAQLCGVLNTVRLRLRALSPRSSSVLFRPILLSMFFSGEVSLSRPLNKIAICFVALLVSLPCFATTDLFVKEAVPVYAKANERSNLLHELKEGDQVVVAPRFNQDGWRKVKFKADGQTLIGYVNGKKLRLSFFKDRKDLKEERKLRERWSIGGGVSVGHLLQESDDITIGSETLDPGRLGGILLGILGYAEMPFEEHKIRGYLIMRFNRYQGQGVSSIGNNLSVTIQEVYIGAGGNAKFYVNKKGKFWLGLGGEMSRAMTREIEASNDATVDEEAPFYAMATASFGWDHKMFSGLYFMPEIRALVNLSPISYGGEIVLSMGVGF